MNKDVNKGVAADIRKLYLFFVLIIAAVTAYIFPYVMDYYVIRSDKDFGDFFSYHIVGNMDKLHISALIIFALVLIIYMLLGRSYIALGIPLLMMMILSYASYIKFMARSELFSYRDLFVTEAAGLATSYLKWDFSKYFFLMLVAAMLPCILLFFIERICREEKRNYGIVKRRLIRLIPGVTGIFILCMIPSALTAATDISDYAMKNKGKQSESCVLFSFIKSDTFSAGDMDSKEAYEYLCEEADDFVSDNGYDGTKPNIIVIMNESWFDVSGILEEGLSTDTDPLEAKRRLVEEKNCVYGKTSVNIYGGGTISSEVEFLFGFNTSYLTSSVGVSDYLEKKEELSSVVSYFKDSGYYTEAVHPYDGEFYSRAAIYKKMGFDRSIFKADMRYTEKYDAYISDAAMAEQIIYEYENREDTAMPLFVWGVSIAGHGEKLDEESALIEDYDYPVKLQGEAYEGYEKDLRTVNSYYNACLAFEKLVDYFEGQDEDTVILMYGDHCPGVSIYYANQVGYTSVDDSLETNMEMYTTPVLLWSSRGAEDISVEGENINYLISLLLEAARLPDCSLTAAFKAQRQEILANTVKYLLDANGKKITAFSDRQERFYNAFGVLQNSILFENENYEELWIKK